MGKTIKTVMEYEEMPMTKYNVKKKVKAVKVKQPTKHEKEYLKLKDYHKKAIKKARSDIRRHRLLIRQAKLNFKIKERG